MPAPMSLPLRLTIAALLLAALALGGWHLWRFAGHSAGALAYRGPLDGQEGTLLHEARLILRGEPLYQPLQLDRVVGAPYPPVHAYALAAAEYLAPGGTPPAPGEAIFGAGRLISLGAMLAAAGLLGLAAWRLGAGWAALLAPPMLLAAAPAQLWATRIKPDPLALALTAGGLLCAALTIGRAGRAGRPAWLVAAALLFAAAYFTKQTYIAAPLAVGLSLLLGSAELRRPAGWRALVAGRRLLILFGLCYALAVGLTWALLDLATAGQFTFHVWGLHPPEWWLYGRFLRYLGLLLPAWPLIALGLLGLLLAARAALAARRLPPAERVLPLLYAGLGAGTLVGAGTIGSHHNHLLEPTLALTLGGACVAGSLVGALGKQSGAGLGRAIGGLLAAALLLGQGASYVQRPEWYGGEFDLGRNDWERFVALLQSQPGEVLSDEVGLMLLAGKEPRYDDPPTMGPAARSGLWDQRGLLREVEERRFDLILLHFDATKQTVDSYGRWSPEFIAALRANYRLLYRDVYFSYVPIE